MPKVSFVMPAYKRSFLREAIASILAQTYTDFELVIVDDASPENLKEVVDTFSDSRLVYYRNEHNIGGADLAAAWNHAMKYASGEWCVLAGDDDVYHKDYLYEMMRLSEKYPKVDIFHCRTGNIDADGNLLNWGDCHPEYETCLEYLYFHGCRRYNQGAPDFMFRHSALLRIGGFISFPAAIWSDDATWYKLAQVNGIGFSSSLLFYFRLSGVSVSTRRDNLFPKIEATYQFMKWADEFLRNLAVEKKEQELKHYVDLHLPIVCSGMADYFFGQAPLRTWFKLVRTVSFPSRKAKHNAIKNRFRRLVLSAVYRLSLGYL